MLHPAGGRFRIDLHVHTGRYSQCAELVDPYRVAPAARRAGLHGVVLTEHDIFWQDEEIELLRQASPGLAIYRGIEVSAAGCHLVVIGIDDAALLERGMPVPDVSSVAARMGACVILAHPYRDGDPTALPVHLVDAIEVASTSVDAREAALAAALAARIGKPPVAASDAHALSRIGWAWTELPFLPTNETELSAAIRTRQGLPVAPSFTGGETRKGAVAG